MLGPFDPSWSKIALWRACNNETIPQRLNHALHPNATVRAETFLEGCKLDMAQWSFSDSCGYFAAAWPAQRSACNGEVRRVGPNGDGGKEVCRPAELYSSRACTVVCVGRCSLDEHVARRCLEAMGRHMAALNHLASVFCCTQAEWRHTLRASDPC